MSEPWDQDYIYRDRTKPKESNLNPRRFIKNILTVIFFSGITYAAVIKHYYVNRKNS